MFPYKTSSYRQFISRSIALAALLLALSLASQARAAEPVPAPDNSLSTDEYVALGLPAVDKTWGGDEYTKAGSVISDIGAKDPTKLPRYNSRKSGNVFDKIISDRNLPTPNNDKETLVKQLASMQPILQGAVAAFLAYNKASTAESTYDTEVLRIGLFLVHAELSSEILAENVLQANPANPAQVEKGITQIKTGMGQTAGGLVEALVEHTTIRTEDSIGCAEDMKTLFPKIYPKLLPEGQAALKVSLKKAAEDEANPNIKAALNAVLAALPE